MKKTSHIQVIKVNKMNHKLTYIETTKILNKNDEDQLYSILILNTLYFPSSLVNVISIES